MAIIKLMFVGYGGMGDIPIYSDNFNNYWACLNYQDADNPVFHEFTLGMDDYDDWETVLAKRDTIQDKWDNPQIVILSNFERDEKVKKAYMLLSRLQSDCEYFLGYGHQNEERLWGKTINAHIAEMKRLWASIPFDKKPEWLTFKEIEEYGKTLRGAK